MRKALFALALVGSAVYGSAAAAIIIAPPSGETGSGPTQATVLAGEQVTFSGPPTAGAESVVFTIKDASDAVVYSSGNLPATTDVSFTWFPLFDGTYKVEESSYVGGEKTGTSTVVYVQAKRPDAFGAITGGGWFRGGAGRDSFGFVGQVLKNGTIRGNVEFQDHAARVNLKSSTIDWVYAPIASKGYIGGTCNGSSWRSTTTASRERATC